MLTWSVSIPGCLNLKSAFTLEVTLCVCGTGEYCKWKEQQRHSQVNLLGLVSQTEGHGVVNRAESVVLARQTSGTATVVFWGVCFAGLCVEPKTLHSQERRAAVLVQLGFPEGFKIAV